jgi:hypothetical protein
MELVRPTWLLRAGAPGYHRSVPQPTLGRSELSAADSPVESWASGTFGTDGRAQGVSWRTQTGLSAGKLVSFPFADLWRIAGRKRLTPESALRLDGRSARHISLGGRKGILLLFASHHSFP